jgi:hypothetical protein
MFVPSLSARSKVAEPEAVGHRSDRTVVPSRCRISVDGDVFFLLPTDRAHLRACASRDSGTRHDTLACRIGFRYLHFELFLPAGMSVLLSGSYTLYALDKLNAPSPC